MITVQKSENKNVDGLHVLKKLGSMVAQIEYVANQSQPR